MNSAMVAMVATLVVWLGLFAFMFRLEARVKKLERDQE